MAEGMVENEKLVTRDGARQDGKELGKLLNDQKINFDLVVKYRRTSDSGVAVDTTESRREESGWRSQYS